MTADVLTCIHNKMNSFSKGQRKIASYILESYDKAAFLTAGALGKTVQVSESTVVRFAAELGYDGYPEMQKAMQEMVLNRLTSVQRIEVSEKRMSDDDVLSSVLQADKDLIHATSEQIDQKAFHGAVDALMNAQTIYVIGVRSSSALASFLSYYFKYMFRDVRLITSASDSEVFEQIVRISPQDALIAISFPRYSSAAIQAAEYAHASGAKVIALTDCASSPLAEFSEFVLTAKSDMVSLVDSLVAPMSVINALIVAAASKKKLETTRIFNKLEEIWDIYHVYEKLDD
ncbi:MAG: MurR/RpiR family transcriptional regulator [Oscillospiraceae bacterium]|nr:MurR/RpiR family transcriptional regulator [Oscillospiraceae bacterium]